MYVRTDLLGRLKHPVKGSAVQELLFALTPFMLYPFFIMVATLFLLDPSDKQFVFSLLPEEMRASKGWMLIGALVEYRFMHFLMSMAHFGAFQSVTFLRVIQTSLADYAGNIR